MKIYIRTDSSTEIGTGHVMRCLTLADILRGKGAEVKFICRDLPGNISDFIEKKGYFVYRLPYQGRKIGQKNCYAHWLGADWSIDAEQTKDIIRQNNLIDWLIIDHYAIDINWERKLRPYVKKIMVIDDLANRPHDCDLLLDQNFYEDLEKRYDKLVPGHCVKLLGPKYALLRPEFIAARKKVKVRDGRVKRILVFFGGSDPTNETAKALEAIRMLNRPDIITDVVVGSANPRKEQIRLMCQSIQNTNFYCQVDNMALLMARADLAIGAGGGTTWERCCLGLPTIAISVADNQKEVLNVLHKYGVLWNLGCYYGVGINNIIEKIKLCLSKPECIELMAKKALMLIGELYISAINDYLTI